VRAQGVAIRALERDVHIVGTVEGGDNGHGCADRMAPQRDVEQIEFDLRLLIGDFLDLA
jgi:hypothetical protein